MQRKLCMILRQSFLPRKFSLVTPKAGEKAHKLLLAQCGGAPKAERIVQDINRVLTYVMSIYEEGGGSGDLRA